MGRTNSSISSNDQICLTVILTIPELLRKILKRCSNSTEQTSLLKTCKDVYYSLDTKYKEDLKKTVQLEYHLKLGKFMCNTDCVITYMLTRLCQMIDNKHPLVQTLLTLYFIHEAIKHTLYVIGLPSESESEDSNKLYLYYHGNHDKQDDTLYTALYQEVTAASQNGKDLESIFEDLNIWNRFINRLTEVITQISHLKDVKTYKRHTSYSDYKISDEILNCKLYSRYFCEWCQEVENFRSRFSDVEVEKFLGEYRKNDVSQS